ILGARFPTPATNKRIEMITVRHLLENASGFSNFPNNPQVAYPHLSPEELIRTVINEPARALTRDPGTVFDSVGLDSIALARVIEQISGVSYEQFVKANVLTPAGITDMVIGGDTPAARKPQEASYFPADTAYQRK